MNEDEIVELFRYCSPRSILVVTWYGRLKKLNCPFTVKVQEKVGNLTLGTYVQVEKVKLTNKLKTVFIINGKAYYYSYFDIITHL